MRNVAFGLLLLALCGTLLCAGLLNLLTSRSAVGALLSDCQVVGADCNCEEAIKALQRRVTELERQWSHRNESLESAYPDYQSASMPATIKELRDDMARVKQHLGLD